MTSDRRVPALIGTAVVILVGIRSVFRWHEDWQRFTQACTRLTTARWLHQHQVPPYDGDDRDVLLVQAVADIQADETGSWIELRRTVDPDR